MDLQATLSAIVGYLNFSDGSASPAFRRQVNSYYEHCAAAACATPWLQLRTDLSVVLADLQQNNKAFAQARQAEQVLDTVFDHFLPAYRQFHQDLLFAWSDAELFQPLFLARIFEVVLQCGGPYNETERLIPAAIEQLNDFLGYRPIPVLETAQSLPYAHERVGALPIYFREVGVGVGQHQQLLEHALRILQQSDPDLRRSLWFDLTHLEEIALDPRPYDYTHPVNRRPCYMFGEWDPHQVNSKGFYRRFILRPLILDALWAWRETQSERPYEEVYFEAAAVLAGTILMASGISGSGPNTHGSDVTMSKLVPIVAQWRDQFYKQLLELLDDPQHVDRLKREERKTHQPFGGIRQFLNQYLSQQRAAQIEYDHLAQLYAKMGYSEVAREQANIIPATAIRMRCQLQILHTQAYEAIERRDLEQAARLVTQIEIILHRAIECGALVDPWNILGFQGNFSLFPAPEDTIADSRILQLLEIIERYLHLQSQLLLKATFHKATQVRQELLERFRKFANWWDQFASFEVSDLPRVCGREYLAAAQFVSKVLLDWQQAEDRAGDVAFWSRHADGFTSPQSYAMVLQYLLERDDAVAAQALMIHWLSNSDQVPLEETSGSFAWASSQWVLERVRRALNRSTVQTPPILPNSDTPATKDVSISDDADKGVVATGTVVHREITPPESVKFESATNAETDSVTAERVRQMMLLRKFFDFVEANAGSKGETPTLRSMTTESRGSSDFDDPLEESFGENRRGANDLVGAGTADNEDDEDDSRNLFQAAYEGMTYRDSTDDGNESDTMGVGGPSDSAAHGSGETEELYAFAEQVQVHLHFLINRAQLWQMASLAPWQQLTEDQLPAVRNWVEQVYEQRQGLFQLVRELHAQPLPTPHGSPLMLIEYERQRATREELIGRTIAAAIELSHAHCMLVGAANISLHSERLKEWERQVIRVRRALWRFDTTVARRELASLLRSLNNVPLLYVPLHKGGRPEAIYQSRYARDTLHRLSTELPCLGMFRETFHVLRHVLEMERRQPPQKNQMRITEFNLLFPVAFRAVMEQLVRNFAVWNLDEEKVAGWTNEIIGRFANLWISHVKEVQLSELERRLNPRLWRETLDFIRRYGRELLTKGFLQPPNMRAILHQGATVYLDYLQEHHDPTEPMKLLEELGKEISREKAAAQLEFILQVLMEHYEVYRDYFTTSTQSDHGDNLSMLLEILRVGVRYDRDRLCLEPTYIAHRVLVKNGFVDAAHRLADEFEAHTRELSESHERELEKLHQRFGFRLTSVADRVGERFVRPLSLDRLTMLLNRAVQSRGQEFGEHNFAIFRENLEQFRQQTVSAGLDVPSWVRQLEHEADKYLEKFPGAEPVEEEDHLLRSWLPTFTITPADFLNQLEHWEQPVVP